MTETIDIIGIGNAIVDVIARTEPSFLAQWEMTPGGMALIDEERAHALTDALAGASPATSGGGSVANSCVAAAMLGARVAYLGKVADDDLGGEFARDMRDIGVRFISGPFVADAPTARCLIAVTPDGQRTMSTFLGAATRLSPDDVDEETIASAAILYLEGYLFDPPSAQAAFRKAAGAGKRVAISLSDAFCVERHRDAFHGFIHDHADIVFANEAEIRALYQIDDIDACADRLVRDTDIGIITLGAAGSLIATGAERIRIAAEPTSVVDTTGAGDAYAAGFLAGLSRDMTLGQAGHLASLMAAEVISHVGARPLRIPPGAT